MNALKKIAKIFAPTPRRGAKSYWIYVQCKRCKEKLRARIDLWNDLSIEYGERETDQTYFCRKLIIGEKLCFQQIEVELTFDKDHQLIDRRIKGGEFLTADEFSAGEAE